MKRSFRVAHGIKKHVSFLHQSRRLVSLKYLLGGLFFVGNIADQLYMIHVTYERAGDQTHDEPTNAALYRELRESNQLGQYWKLETPEVLETAKNVIRYYPKHGKLVVHLPDHCSRKDFSVHVGKGVGINLAALEDEPEVLHRLIEILQEVESNAS